MREYAQIARQYCEDVAASLIPACKWVKLACAAHITDLGRVAEEAYPYYFDEAAAARVCFFIEKLPHIKGPLSGQLIKLEPWQVFILARVFGWLKKATGKRRFRRVYIEVPRGNGKSALSSGVALYMLAADKEGGPEVYSAARVKEQARIVFDVAKKMLRTGPGIKLRERFGLTVLEHSISHPAGNGLFVPVSSDAQALDGGNTHFACLDELHAHPTAEVYEVFDTSTGKRDQSLLWSITTAGTDPLGICYTTRDYGLKVLDGIFTDDTCFTIVYTIDKDDDWAEPLNWRKANPNYGVSVFADDIEQKARKAIQQVSAQTNFKTKHLDIWQSGGDTWMDMRKFALCADTSLREEDFNGRQCVIGMDLASKLDLLSNCRVFWENIEGKRHYYVFWSHWTPEQRVLEGPVAYRTWAAEGWLKTCPGVTNDFTEVEDGIRDACRAFDVKEVAHDPFGALEMVNKLTGEQIPMIEVTQNVKNVSPAMREIEAAVADGCFHFNGDPVASWAMSNVMVKPDKKDNIFAFKLTQANKIDPAAALFTAVIRVMNLDSLNEGDGEVTAVGACEKCATMCIGTSKGDVLSYICPECKKGLAKEAH